MNWLPSYCSELPQIMPRRKSTATPSVVHVPGRLEAVAEAELGFLPVDAQVKVVTNQVV